MKEITGEKYIYLAMAYSLAKASGGMARIGNDNGAIGGQNFWRRFNIQNYDGHVLLTETKSSPHFANYSRTFEVRDIDALKSLDIIAGRIRVYEYFNESNENCSDGWTH